MINPNQPGANLARQRFRDEQGASLLEVLVAMVVITVGLLGIAGLSSSTLSYNKAAQYRLSGLTLVNDYADRARANVYGYDRGGYDLTETSTATAPADDIEQVDAATAADNVATGDRAELLTLVADRFPGGKAVVSSNPTTQSRNMDVWLLWEEASVDSADELLVAGKKNCPASADDKYSCMYFSVGL